ncbi:MFS transporter [Nordella sp. HKS 07]|uniref:MFS transporter n=1 Tax=Nordella sp. HKS 07 TaxID=2712222 RepID=UPI0013E1A903|nr:MFS transporter [Nordella sp. HKS 07]QIG47100.1 MFS transporter [Nordella sp. HKS 07]
MTETTNARVDWLQLWRSGDLARFCFISLGIMLHATNETMVMTVMPAMLREIEGVQYVGWSFAIYEIGSIVAGAATGRLVSFVSLRANLVIAALLFMVGCVVCALATSMQWFLVGRLLEGFGGGGLVALAFVSVERLFSRDIWPQLFAIMSVIWGVSAFSGPMLGALAAEYINWRWAFGVSAVGGLAMAVASLIVLRMRAAGEVAPVAAGKPPAFPFEVLACLAVSVILIAMAGLAIAPLRSSLFLISGLIGIGLVFVLDSRRPESRLFPSRPFNWRSPVGTGMTMIGAFSVATCSFGLYAPLILTQLHGVPLLTSGYIIASESIAWSVLSILVANTRPEREGRVVMLGALMIAGGVVGFAYAVPAGSLPLILFCAILQGGGFGMAWPFVTRMIVDASLPGEKTIASSAVPTMQRMGYAVGAAIAGIIANAGGFAHGLSAETAQGAASWLFIAFLPLAAVGCLAGWKTARG